MPNICEGDLIQVANQLRKIYTEYRRMHNPGFRPTSDRHRRIWKKAAEICLQENIDPERYVAAQFHGLVSPGPTVLANRQGAVTRYHRYIREATDTGQTEVYVNSQITKVMSRAQCGYDMHLFLSDPVEIICPMLRYVSAVVLGFTDIATSMLDEAKEYARTHPDVAAIIRERFPEVKQCQEI